MEPEPIPLPSLPRRSPDQHKGSAGHLLVVAGSAGMSGAARLCALSALASGAGLVTVAVPEPIRAEVAGADPALMVRGVRSTSSGAIAGTAFRDVLELASARDVVVVGPGLGRHPHTLALVRRLLRGLDRPVVLDADGLRALEPGAASAEAARTPRVLTPHPGEAAHLLGSAADEIQRDRIGAARELHRRTGAVVVLKGRHTLVTDGTTLRRNTTGNPGLAVGGTGDVLAGMIGSLIGQGFPPFEAACLAVHLHGAAADDLLPVTGERGMTPMALIAALPGTIRRHEGPRLD